MATNPIILAGVGIGAAFLWSRRASAEVAPPNAPSTTGTLGRVSRGVSAAEFSPGKTSECLLPDRWGYVQPAMPPLSKPGPLTNDVRHWGMPVMWQSPHAGEFRIQAGKTTYVLGFNRRGGVFQTTERNKRRYVVPSSSGDLSLPSRASLEYYYPKRPFPRFGWYPIPAGNQATAFNEFVRSGVPFFVPDTELSTAQMQLRTSNGQVSADYFRRRSTAIVRREGFYVGDEFFVRSDGADGSTNWRWISDEDPAIRYFVSERGFVALDTRTMTNAFTGQPDQAWRSLKPRWKRLGYGAVPMASDPWTIPPFSGSSRPDPSGGSDHERPGRRVSWSPGNGFGGADFGSYWPNVTPHLFPKGVRAFPYPRDSSFQTAGIRLPKVKSGPSDRGCRNERCFLTCLVQNSAQGAVVLPGGYGITGGPGEAPFDFSAPVYLNEFVQAKMTNYRTDIQFSGDLQNG